MLILFVILTVAFAALSVILFFRIRKGTEPIPPSPTLVGSEQLDRTEPSEDLNEKNKKLWAMSEAVYKEKKKVDELNETLANEKQKLEQDKKKVDEKVKKLWSQSMAIHKEKERINELKQIVEQKHQEVMDSVTYAKRIQEAILPDKREVQQHLPQSFILFLPRDIVSGDFYWFSEKDGRRIIASVDCTGHGVPGAFMSMIGNTLLNQIVNERGVTEPAQILNFLNAEINYVLKQGSQESESKDGMDVAICAFMDNGKMEYAGANRPLYIYRKGELMETKATKFPIGGSSYETEKVFSNHVFELQQGDMVYIFSDGYADQFSKDDKKLMTKRFKELLKELSTLEVHAQMDRLQSFIETWRGNTHQTDDILVIGVRI